MRKLAAALFLAFISTTSWALDIGGITIPETLKIDDQQALNLNGAGIREKWFMDLYVGALFLSQNKQDATAILDADETMAIRLHIISGMITSKKMTNATVEGFENSTGGNTEPFKKEIDQFLNTFKEPIAEGDVFDFVYAPGKGVQIIKNGTLAQNIDSSAQFKKVLFGIWLSDKPAQKSLKSDMLSAKS